MNQRSYPCKKSSFRSISSCRGTSSLNQVEITSWLIILFFTRKYLPHSFVSFFNTSYLTDTYIIFTLKMESVFKNTIFGLKMMVKSGLEKMILKFLPVGNYFHLLHKRKDFCPNYKFIYKNYLLPALKIFFLDHFSLFRPKMVILDTYSMLRVKAMAQADRIKTMSQFRRKEKAILARYFL